ncbi:MAG: type I restriction endonuclease, partial [Tenericutes bacterium HGW-Tenericutes-7]
YRTELDRQFKNEKSNFKIAIVVDMWLTGFDVPSLDTMYIDKPLQEHTLIQTISRVNRVYPGKEKGLIVDYFGFKSHMNLALKKFNRADSEVFEGIDEAIKIVKDELDILRRVFKNFDDAMFFTGSPVQKLNCLKHASEYVQLTDDLEKRFMASVKRMKSAYDLCSSSENISKLERDKIYFYGAVRSIIFKLTKGDAPDTAQMNDYVRKMIQEAILSEGVEEVFTRSKIVGSRSVDIFSDEYLERINKIPLKNTKIKVLTKLLKDAIEAYKKVNRIKGIQFSEKLQKMIDSYNNRHGDKVYAEEILDNVAEELTKLLKELEADKESFKDLGIDFEEKAFFDILVEIAKQHDFYEDYIKQHGEQKLIELSKEMKKIVDDKSRYTDWAKKEDIKADLKVSIILTMADYGYPPVVQDEVFKEIFLQAENFKKYQ